MSNDEKVTVRALRRFEGEEGFKTPASAPFPVEKRRADELKKLGLVEVVKEQATPAVVKAEPEAPQNKMEPEPKNKAEESPSPRTAASRKRTKS